ncbi:MAG TPA: DUF6263 family protein [Chitinophagaceae bacterium]|nr:DUF6263 family protein [Chitinophagaceae bacterium]
MDEPGFSLLRGVLAGCLALCCGNLGAQDAIHLSYTFHTGDHYQMDQDSKLDNYQTFQGIPTRVTQQTISSVDFRVKEVSNGKARLTVRFLKLFLNASSNNQQMTINTAVKENDQINALFKKIIGKPFSITMEADGRVDSVSGLQQITRTLMQGVSDTNNADQIALKGLLESQISPAAVRTSLEQSLPEYPGRDLNTGDKWQKVIQVPGPPAGTMTNTWMLTYGDKFSVQLSLNAVFSTADPNQVIPLGNGYSGKINMSGTVQGHYAINPSTGWPSIVEQHTEYQGTYRYNANRKLRLKSALNVPVRIVSDNEIKILHL